MDHVIISLTPYYTNKCTMKKLTIPTINVWGRPKRWTTPKKLEQEIQEYFASCYELRWKERDWRDESWNRQKLNDGTYIKEPYQEWEMIKIPTVSGLAFHLWVNRQTLLNYEDDEKFFGTIKRAKQFLESVVEEWAMSGRLNPASAIFNLKNNYWWKDKSEVWLTDKDGNDIIEKVNLHILTTPANATNHQRLTTPSPQLPDGQENYDR